MKYVAWLWQNTRGIRWNMVVRIVTGIIQVALGLLMVWLSRLFIDETIRTGEADEVLRMVCWLVLTVVGGVLLRQLNFYMTTMAGIRQTNVRRLRQMTHDIRQDESRIQMQIQEGMEHNAVLRSLGSEQWVTGRLDTMPQRASTAWRSWW